MGTLVVTASGFAALPASQPADWPPGIAYPAGGNPSGTKTVTLSDADWQQLVSWAAWNYVTPNQASGGGPTVITAPQILLALIVGWHKAMTDAVQKYHTTPPQVPPPITIS